MSEVESKLRSRLTDEEFQLALQLIRLTPSRVRVFIEEAVEGVLKPED